MQLKKKFISLLAGISLVALGILTSCGQPTGGTDDGGNENGNKTEIFEPKPEYESVEDGIKLSWGEVPSNIKHIRIYTLQDSRDYTLFDINDLSQYKYVIDENVSAGQEYQYRIVYCDNNWNWIKYSNWFTVKAEAGNGELTFNAEATSTGIKFSNVSVDPKEIDAVTIEKFYDNTINRINVYTPDDDGTFTDKYVENGKKYEYLLRVQMGNNGYIDDDKNEIPADPIVKYPRFKSVSVTAIAGAGSITTTVLPQLDYNPSTKEFTLIQKPDFSDMPNAWNLSLCYKKTNEGYNQFVWFSNENKHNDVKPINTNIPDGLWSFGYCWFWLQFEQYEYEYPEYSLSDVPATIPINVNVDELFMPVATSTDEGIKIEWKNLPENTKILEIRDCKNRNILFEIQDLSTVKSVTDKYVTKGSSYEYYFIARGENNSWEWQTDFVYVFANNGLKERTYTATATNSGIQISGEKVSSASSVSINRFQRGQYDYDDYFKIKNKVSESPTTELNFIDIFVSSGNEYEYNITEAINHIEGWNEYPRSKTVTVKAIGGSGPVAIKNEPIATFSDGKINFIVKPEILSYDGLKYWNAEFGYYCQNSNQYRSLYGYEAFSDGDSVWNNTENNPSGEWKLKHYWLFLLFDSYDYTQHNYNLRNLSKLPDITL